MDLLTNENLQELATQPEGTYVSIYMPTTPIGRDTQQAFIRLKNLIKEAEQKLSERGLRTPEVAELLKPAEALMENEEFWKHQSDGLALFFSKEKFYSYRLPLHFDEIVVVNKRFYLKPLLPLFTGDGQFFVLALSQNMVKLLQCSRDSFNEVELEGVPTSLDEALQFDDPERQLQYHTSGSSPGGAGKRQAIYQGHGGGVDDAKPNILRYFQQVNQGLHEIFKNQNTPLVLAGVEYLQSIYRDVNEYQHLIEEGIEGSPDRVHPKELHEQAWKIVEPLFALYEQEARDRYEQFINSNNGKASKDLKKIISAAVGGQVETLFVQNDIQQWGRFKVETNSIQLHNEPETFDEDLLDFAAVQTILNRGTVYALKAEEMPDESSISAVFRY
jgi:hypothetical protein